MSGRSRFVRLRGLRFHLRCWGAENAPLLLYCHGWLDTSATFSDVGELLGEHFQVIAFDQRGYGYSEWPADGYWFQDYIADLDALCDALSPSAPVLLAGHSMGGQVASLYAGLRPQRVQKLAVIDSLFLPDMPAKIAPRRMLKWLDQLKEPAREKTYASFEELAGRVRKQHPQLSPERALFVARGWGRADAAGQVRLLADPKHRLDMPSLYHHADSAEVWKQVTAPTLFVDAARSDFRKAISPEETATRRACFRNHRAVEIAEAGHMVHFDAPAALANALAAFFRTP